MIQTSITSKFLSLIVVGFMITILSVIIIADTQSRGIVDRSQSALYNEKVDLIWKMLERTNKRLLETGLPNAYAKDFESSVIKTLHETYYKSNSPEIYPFILDQNRVVVMHPVLDQGDFSLQNNKMIESLYESERGEFEGIYLGRKKWYVYRYFSDWDWLIGYSIPVDIKYSDARDLRNMLATVLISISLLVLVVMSILISRFTKPIIQLTKVSSDIADGNLDEPITLERNDEIGTLASSFSRMRDSIKAQILELEEERNRAENIIEGTNAGTWEWNIKTGEVVINERWAEIIGYTAKELESVTITSWLDYLHPECLVKTKDRIDMLFTGEIGFFDIDFRMKHKSGEWIWVNSRGKIIEWDDAGEPFRVSGTHLDINERKQLEGMMVRTEKMTSVAGLAAGMAHEINNPLAAITQSIQNIFRRIDPAKKNNNAVADEYGIDLNNLQKFLTQQKVITFLHHSKDSCMRAADIVRNMLLFSRKSDTTLVLVSLKEIIERVIQIGGTDYDMNMKYDFKFADIVKEYDDVKDVRCCASEIEQVLLNLLKNAVQAMEMIEDDHYKARFIIRLKEERSFVRLEIEDNGPGIPDEIKSRIFEPFFTTKATGVGTGLGLSICYMIITQNHGGTFEVESEVGKGTTFIIRLPHSEC